MVISHDFLIIFTNLLISLENFMKLVPVFIFSSISRSFCKFPTLSLQRACLVNKGPASLWSLGLEEQKSCLKCSFLRHITKSKAYQDWRKKFLCFLRWFDVWPSCDQKNYVKMNRFKRFSSFGCSLKGEMWKKCFVKWMIRFAILQKKIGRNLSL